MTVPARRAAGALVVTAVVAATTGMSAGPAAAAEVRHAYAGSAAADGMSLALNLPQAAGPLPATSVTGFVSAHGELSHDGISHQRPDRATALAAMASGDLVTAAGPLAALNRSVRATRSHPDAVTSLGTMPDNPLASGALGPLEGHVRGLRLATSRAELIRGQLARLGDLLPAQLRQQVDQGLQQGSAALQQALDQALTALGPVLGPLADQDPTGTAAQLQQELTDLSQQLPQLIDNLENSAVLTVDGLRSTQSTRHPGTGSAVVSTASTRLGSLDVLGGLVKLTGFASSVTASANGRDGGAGATASSTVASVQIGDGLLGISLTDHGLSADVAGLLPPDVVKQVNDALGQITAGVNQVLSQAGVSVTPAATSHHAAPDGRTADASASGLLVTLQPPGQPKPLLQIGLGASQARAEAGVTRVLDERVDLPHTGGGLGTGALAGASAALLGGLWLRRRATAR